MWLNACTFGVPLGGGALTESANADAGEKSRYGNPKSYVVMGKRYYVLESSKGFTDRGIASWYGADFHGKRTSSGEVYDMHAMTAAHKTLPLPVYVRVKNLDNGRVAVVKVNDRGPFVGKRIIDLSFAAAKKLGVVGPGTANVEISALDSRNSESRPPVRVVPLVDRRGKSGDIFIQMGSFGSRDNAQKLLADLQQINEKTLMISKAETDNGVFYRVRLGPLLDISEAESVQKRLQQKGYKNARVVIDDE